MRKLDTDKIPEPARLILTELIAEIDSAVPGLLDSFYVVGSIPLDDFYPNKSDIDFIALCSTVPDENQFNELKKIHLRFCRKYPKPDLSGSYLTRENIHAGNPEAIPAVTFHEGKLKRDHFDMGPVALTQLTNYSHALFGDDPANFPVRVSSKTLHAFMYQNINSYWKNWVREHSSFFGRRGLLFLFPRFTEWSVLGVARQLCTLESGKIVSKKEAGEYCLMRLPQAFHPVIHEALNIRRDDRTYPLVRTYAIRPSFRRTKGTLQCVSFLIGEFNKGYKQGRSL
jgi:hypothetical protein